MLLDIFLILSPAGNISTGLFGLTLSNSGSLFLLVVVGNMENGKVGGKIKRTTRVNDPTQNCFKLGEKE